MKLYRRLNRRLILPARSAVCSLLLFIPSHVAAQPDAPAPPSTGVNFTGSLRARVENWDWFSTPSAQSSYSYGSAVLRLGVGQSVRKIEWYAEGSFPAFLNIPDHSVAPEPQGPIGYGGDYFLANGQRNIAAAVLRQAYLGVRSADGRLRLRLGRFEFADGTEATPGDARLALLKQDRINQRLLGTFNYALRSLDGAQLSYNTGHSNVTAMMARVVEGSFQLRATDDIDVNLAYAGYTKYFPGADTQSEARFFFLYYGDERGALKTDNRPMGTLQADHQAIRLATPGAHWIAIRRAGPGTTDFVLWGAGQFGLWGTQAHRASEFAIEAGYHFTAGGQPWIRVGYLRSAGDSRPDDNLHTTFFQVLSSPRAYARFPFYILMNTEDRFIQLRLTPVRKLVLRSELHSVRLTSPSDLWYDGGGAFQTNTFGYLGRPGGGARGLGASLDLSSEYAVSPKTTLAFYAGAGRGEGAAAFLFPNRGQIAPLRLISLELIRRF